MSKNEEKVSRRNIEKLLKELQTNYGHEGPLYDRYRELDAQLDALRARFEASKPYKTLSAKVEKARMADAKEYETRRRAVQAVRQAYYAHGPIPKVMAELQKLIKRFNRSNG